MSSNGDNQKKKKITPKQKKLITTVVVLMFAASIAVAIIVIVDVDWESVQKQYDDPEPRSIDLKSFEGLDCNNQSPDHPPDVRCIDDVYVKIP